MSRSWIKGMFAVGFFFSEFKKFASGVKGGGHVGTVL